MAVSAESINWKKAIDSSGTTPPARWGHSLTAINGASYLFGGCDARETGSNFIFALDFEDDGLFVWTQLDPTGQVPTGRLNHSACEFGGGKLVISGGWNDDTKALTDVYIFNTHKCSWKGLKSELPQGVSCHTSVCSDDQLVIFGGRTKHARVTDQLVIVDLSRDSIDTRIRAGGVVPSARYGHGAAVWNRDMYIFGGWTNDGNRLNTLHRLNLDSLTWSEVEVYGDSPSARSFMQCVTVSDSIVVFGGIDDEDLLDDLHVFSFSDSTWARPPTTGKSLPRTSYPALSIDTERMLAVIYGGQRDVTKQDKTGLHDDIYYSYVAFDSVFSNASQWVSSFNPFSTPSRGSRRQARLGSPHENSGFNGNGSAPPVLSREPDSSRDEDEDETGVEEEEEPGFFGSVSGAIESWTPFLSPRKRPSQSSMQSRNDDRAENDGLRRTSSQNDGGRRSSSRKGSSQRSRRRSPSPSNSGYSEASGEYYETVSRTSSRRRR